MVQSKNQSRYAIIDSETCVDRCQMRALHMNDDGIAEVDDRCIGCGLCVISCPSEALELKLKTGDQVRRSACHQRGADDAPGAGTRVMG